MATQQKLDDLAKQLGRAKWVSQHAVDVAEAFMKNVGDGVPLPSMYEDERGWVNMRWQTSDDAYLVVGIKDGEASVYANIGYTSWSLSPFEPSSYAKAAQEVRRFCGVAATSPK